MMTALIAEPVDEAVMMVVPDKWLRDLPTEMLEAAAWWQLVRGLEMQRGVFPLGPPTNIEWVFTSDVGVVSAIKLRHSCDSCRSGLTAAIDALRAGAGGVAVAQFTQTYLRSKDDRSPFHAKGGVR